jgi:hypothetical protein
MLAIPRGPAAGTAEASVLAAGLEYDAALLAATGVSRRPVLPPQGPALMH